MYPPSNPLTIATPPALPLSLLEPLILPPPVVMCNWRIERAIILNNMQAIIQDDGLQPMMLPTQRLKDFVLRETSCETLPCNLLRQIILYMAGKPSRMTNDWLEMEALKAHWSECLLVVHNR